MDWLSTVRARRRYRVKVTDQIIDVNRLGRPSLLSIFVTEDSDRDHALGCFIT